MDAHSVKVHFLFLFTFCVFLGFFLFQQHASKRYGMEYSAASQTEIVAWADTVAFIDAPIAAPRPFSALRTTSPPPLHLSPSPRLGVYVYSSQLRRPVALATPTHVLLPLSLPMASCVCVRLAWKLPPGCRALEWLWGIRWLVRR